MQTEKHTAYQNDPLFPPVPSDYHERMENVLASLPVESTRTFSPRGFGKKKFLILVAAVVTLLSVGTAMAISVSRMREIGDRAQTVVSNYQAIVNGSGTTTDVSVQNAAQPTPYVTLSEFGTDENGEWLPQQIEHLDVSEQVGAFTIRLDNLCVNSSDDGDLMADLWIEADQPQPYTLENLRLSLNGGEPMRTISETLAEEQTFSITPTPFTADDWSCRNGDQQNPVFEFAQNPLRPGTTFTFTGTLNGSPFTLIYDFTREAYETLKTEQLNKLDAIAKVLSDIPEDAISVNAAIHGSFIEEVALKDHYLYVVWHYDREYRQSHGNSIEEVYEAYDKGLYTVVDGMLSNNDFVSASVGEDGENHMIHRSYFPYDDKLPNESLIAFFGTVFRINWETQTATAPKDDAEYVAWRKESADRSAIDYQTDYLSKPNKACDAFCVRELVYLNKNAAGQFAVILETDEPLKNALYGPENQPVVTVNGVTLDNETSYAAYPDQFIGGTANGGRLNGFWLYSPAYRTLPDTFDVIVSWRGETVTIPMQKTDFEPIVLDSDAYDSVLNF